MTDPLPLPGPTPFKSNPTGSPRQTDNTDETGTSSATIQVAAALKLPPFWQNRPELWFIQVETQFRIRNITAANTKYDYLISSLTPESMEIVADFLMNPSGQDKYVALKNLLILRCKDTEEKRLDSLLHKIDIGDQRPSELFRQMETLAANNSLVNAPLLKKLWLNKLPNNVRPCIIALESTHSNEELFDIADKINASATSISTSSSISAVNTRPGGSDLSGNVSYDRFDELKDMIRKLSSRIDNLDVNYNRSRSRERSFRTSPIRRSSRTRSPSRSEDRLCWYHRRYRNRAARCIQPCGFDHNGPSPNQKN